MRNFRTVLEEKIWERRQTLEEFAEYAETFARERREPGTLGVRHLQRLVAGRGANGQPLGPVRPATARLLESIFGVSVEKLLALPDSSGVAQPSTGRNDLSTVLEWLDGHAGWSPGTTRRKVAAVAGDDGAAHDRRARRARVGRTQTVDALAEYYSDSVAGHGLYGVRCGNRHIVTSIVTRPGWIDLDCALGDGDRLTLVPSGVAGPEPWDEVTSAAAVRRLADVIDSGVRMTNVPLYRLVGLDAGRGKITGTVALASFVEYSPTMDLLEGELADAVASASSALPLRDRYLPNLAAVLDVSDRLCAGGVLALCAIARPADPYRGPADYALLVQERSGSVLNAAGRLAVIPKGFHQPMSDLRADAQIGVTLRRELARRFHADSV